MRFQELVNLTSSFEMSFQFLKLKGVLPQELPLCELCRREMSIVKSNCHLTDKYVYRCPTHKSKKKSIRNGSFLANSHILFKEFSQIAYFWAYKIPVINIIEMTGKSNKTIIQWYSYFKDACSYYFEENDHLIGGVGHIVEIDESIFAKRKYNRDRLVQEK